MTPAVPLHANLKNLFEPEDHFLFNLMSRILKQRLTPTDLSTSLAGRSSEAVPGASLHPDWVRSLPFDLAPCESSGGRDAPNPNAQRGEGWFLLALQLKGGTQRSGRCWHALGLSPKMSRHTQQEVEYWVSQNQPQSYGCKLSQYWPMII